MVGLVSDWLGWSGYLLIFAYFPIHKRTKLWEVDWIFNFVCTGVLLLRMGSGIGAVSGIRYDTMCKS